MLARLRFVLVVSVVLVAPQAVEASPITYDFAGTFNQPINGSDQFSGSFTINGNPTLDNSGAMDESGADVSLTVNMGGKTVNYVNTQQDPNNVTFSGNVATDVFPVIGGNSTSQSEAVYTISRLSQPNDPVGVLLWFDRPGTSLQLGDLTTLSSPSFTNSVQVTYDSGGQTQVALGSITSIEQVSAPEPSMLAVFGAMAIAGMARRRMPRLPFGLASFAAASQVKKRNA